VLFHQGWRVATIQARRSVPPVDGTCHACREGSALASWTCGPSQFTGRRTGARAYSRDRDAPKCAVDVRCGPRSGCSQERANSIVRGLQPTRSSEPRATTELLDVSIPMSLRTGPRPARSGAVRRLLAAVPRTRTCKDGFVYDDDVSNAPRGARTIELVLPGSVHWPGDGMGGVMCGDVGGIARTTSLCSPGKFRQED
jgi:hypothetical protein